MFNQDVPKLWNALFKHLNKHCSTAWPASYWTIETKDILPQKPHRQHWWWGRIYNADSVFWWQTWGNQYYKISDRSCQGLQLLNPFVMLETELWLETTGLVILGGNQPQLGSKSCKVEIDRGGVWKRHADQMTTTDVGNGIEDEPVSNGSWTRVEVGQARWLCWPELPIIPEVPMPAVQNTEPGDKLPRWPLHHHCQPPPPPPPHQHRDHLDNDQLTLGTVWTNDQEANTLLLCLYEGEDSELTYSIYQYMYRIVVVCDWVDSPYIMCPRKICLHQACRTPQTALFTKVTT